MAMLSLEEAQERLLALAPELPSQTLELPCHPFRHYLARDHTALRTQPSADLSAMDGYALCGDGPWELVGESRAGAPFGNALSTGQCTRISTGAHLPEGADRVLVQEDARREDARVYADETPPPGHHIRRAGFDFASGDTVLSAGEAITPAILALAIAAGHTNLEVTAPPSIAILDSGDELVPIGQIPGAHQIPASNGAMISAMLNPLVGKYRMIGPVADNLTALDNALRHSEDCDILITSGGASVGDHDLVQTALRNRGAKIDFWKVAIKPGKPLMIATRETARRNQVILGLPGNPVSSFVTCFLFALPLVRKALGARDPLPTAQRLAAATALPSTGPRREFVRGVSDGVRVWPTTSQDSSALASLAKANCLIDRPSHSPQCPAGEYVAVYSLPSA